MKIEIRKTGLNDDSSRYEASSANWPWYYFAETPEKAVYKMVGMIAKKHQDASDAAAGAIAEFRRGEE